MNISDLHDCSKCKFTDGSKVSQRVCSSCFDKTSWEPKTAVYTVDIDVDVQTRINLNPCPLPRIGSKEWGWTEDVCRDWHSALTEQVVVGDEFDSYYAVVLRGCKRADAIDTCSEAKRIAELLARRDWRRENGRKI